MTSLKKLFAHWQLQATMKSYGEIIVWRSFQLYVSHLDREFWGVKTTFWGILVQVQLWNHCQSRHRTLIYPVALCPISWRTVTGFLSWSLTPVLRHMLCSYIWLQDQWDESLFSCAFPYYLFPLVQGIDMYLLKSGWDLCCEWGQPSLSDRACATSGAFHHISVDFISSGRMSGTTNFSARKTTGNTANSKPQPTTPSQ